MQESIEDTPEESQSDEFIQRTLNKSDCEMTPDELQVENEEVQRAKKTLADFLKPAVMAAKSGELSEKTPDEIFKVAMDIVKVNRKSLTR